MFSSGRAAGGLFVGDPLPVMRELRTRHFLHRGGGAGGASISGGGVRGAGGGGDFLNVHVEYMVFFRRQRIVIEITAHAAGVACKALIRTGGGIDRIGKAAGLYVRSAAAVGAGGGVPVVGGVVVAVLHVGVGPPAVAELLDDAVTAVPPSAGGAVPARFIARGVTGGGGPVIVLTACVVVGVNAQVGGPCIAAGVADVSNGAVAHAGGGGAAGLTVSVVGIAPCRAADVAVGIMLAAVVLCNGMIGMGTFSIDCNGNRGFTAGMGSDISIICYSLDQKTGGRIRRWYSGVYCIIRFVDAIAGNRM